MTTESQYTCGIMGMADKVGGGDRQRTIVAMEMSATGTEATDRREDG